MTQCLHSSTPHGSAGEGSQPVSGSERTAPLKDAIATSFPIRPFTKQLFEVGSLLRSPHHPSFHAETVYSLLYGHLRLYLYSYVFCWMQTDLRNQSKGFLLLFSDLFCTKQGNTGRALTRQMSSDNYTSVTPNIKNTGFLSHTTKPYLHFGKTSCGQQIRRNGKISR